MITDPIQLNRLFYDTHAEEYCRRTTDLEFSGIYEPFLKLLPKRGEILDAGCGAGRDSLAFLKRGYKVTAIDASIVMVSLATALGITAKAVAFQEMEFTSLFDGIWAHASLLHVPHSQISDVLDRFALALKPSGILYVSLKEGHGESIAKDGRFFSYFRQDEFKQLLVERGSFASVTSWITCGNDSAGSQWSWLNYIAKKSK